MWACHGQDFELDLVILAVMTDSIVVLKVTPTAQLARVLCHHLSTFKWHNKKSYHTVNFPHEDTEQETTQMIMKRGIRATKDTNVRVSVHRKTANTKHITHGHRTYSKKGGVQRVRKLLKPLSFVLGVHRQRE